MPKEVNIEELENYLRIDKNSLDEELKIQPELFYRISDSFVQASARRDRLKEEISRVDADLYSKHRRKLEKETGKATETQVNQAIIMDKKHKKAVDEHIKAKEYSEHLGSLKEAFSQRSYMLRELCSLFVSNYYETSAIKSNQAGKEISYQETTGKMAEKRHKKKRRKKNENNE